MYVFAVSLKDMNSESFLLVNHNAYNYRTKIIYIIEHVLNSAGSLTHKTIQLN